MSLAPDSASDSLWEQLVKTALLGSERSPLPPLSGVSDTALTGLLSQLKSVNPEAALLRSAALLAVYESCGTVAESATPPSLPPSLTDASPRCSPGAASYLRRILTGQFLFLLPEFMHALHTAGKRVPEELLPEVLESAKKDSGLRAAVAAVMGRRGEWVASLNTDWNFIGAQIAGSEWETGTRGGRLALLRHLRQSNPEQAIVLLQSTWNTDAPEDRVAFIAELQVGLSPKDEPFLEGALDDRRKEVRQHASDLLMRLPRSALVQRMWQRVAPRVRMDKSSGLKLKKLLGKRSLEIDLPEDCDEAMQRDGVEPKPPQGVGQKAWWLQQMVRAVPPTQWETHLDLSPEQCVDAFHASEFGNALLIEVAESVKRHGDSRWAKPLIEIAVARAKDAGSMSMSGETWSMLEVVGAMEDKHRDAVMIKRLDHHGDTGDLALALRLLHSCPGPWSLPLGRSLLNLLRHITRQMAEGKHQPLWAGLGDLTALSTRMPVALAEEAQEGWPEDSAAKTFFRPVQTIIDILQFRSKMLKEISR